MSGIDTPGDDGDTRLDTGYVETIGDDAEPVGTVTLVGVVHDHPASVYRVERVVDGTDPGVLALELPPLAVPLYEAFAADGESPPAHGGEFTAAVQAAPTADVVGVDGPSARFARTLAEQLVHERASLRTVGRSLRSMLAVSRTALACRVAAAVTRRTSRSVVIGSPTAHGTSRDDPPDEQAADERRQIRTATAVAAAIEPSPSTRYRTESRERHMAECIDRLRRRGDVVAVVGAGHFEAVRERLSSP